MVFFSTLILFVIYLHTITSEWIQLVCHISTVFFFCSALVFSLRNILQFENPNCNGRYDEFNEYLHLNHSYLCTTIPPHPEVSIDFILSIHSYSIVNYALALL